MTARGGSWALKGSLLPAPQGVQAQLRSSALKSLLLTAVLVGSVIASEMIVQEAAVEPSPSAQANSSLARTTEDEGPAREVTEQCGDALPPGAFSRLGT